MSSPLIEAALAALPSRFRHADTPSRLRVTSRPGLHCRGPPFLVDNTEIRVVALNSHGGLSLFRISAGGPGWLPDYLLEDECSRCFPE